MNDNENINPKSLESTRRIKLKKYQSLLTEKNVNHLNYLLMEKNYNEFDKIIDSSLDGIKQVVAFYNKNNESMLNDEQSKDIFLVYTTKINELEKKLDAARFEWKENKETINQLEIELASIFEEKIDISNSLKSLIAENAELQKNNSELQSQIQQNRIDEKVPDYVKGVKKKLQQDDTDFTAMSYNWAIAGIIIALLAIIAAFVTFFIKIDIKDTTLTELFYYFSRGLLGVALLSWLSFFCLSNSKKYTHEAIIRKDRQHALMFGEVFLQIYGSTATKEDAINVFKDWNMSANSAFSDQTEQPPGVQSILSSLKENFSSKEKA